VHVLPILLEGVVVLREDIPGWADRLDEAAVVGRREIDDAPIAGDGTLFERRRDGELRLVEPVPVGRSERAIRAA